VPAPGGQCTPLPYAYGTTLFMRKWCLPDYNTLNNEIQNDFTKFVTSAGAAYLLIQLQQVLSVYWIYIVCLVTCLLLLYLHNMMLKYCVNIMMWWSILFVALGVFLLGLLVHSYADTFYAKSQAAFFMFAFVAWILWFSMMIFLMSVCCIWKRLQVSVQVLRAASKVIHLNYKLIFAPLVAIIFAAGAIFVTIWFLIYLSTCGKLKAGQVDGLTYYVYVFTDL
jgi:hypothetical protein